MLQLLTNGTEPDTREELERQFSQYVHEEYHAVMKGLKILLRRLPGLYRKDP
ncbi:MAG: hypothetical protein ACFFAE_21465 [Candidatus Hodarchaeota archaeon]